MITAGIKEVKNNLSRYLARVKLGEDILITDRGEPVARIVKENQRSNDIRNALLPLLEKGIVSLPGRAIDRNTVSPLDTGGKPVSEMVVEDRR